MVYLPTRPVDEARVEIQVHEMVDGRRGLFCYSALDRLQDLHPAVPGWLAIDVAGLQRILDDDPDAYHLLFLDRAPRLVDRSEEARG